MTSRRFRLLGITAVGLAVLGKVLKGSYSSSSSPASCCIALPAGVPASTPLVGPAAGAAMSMPVASLACRNNAAASAAKSLPSNCCIGVIGVIGVTGGIWPCSCCIGAIGVIGVIGVVGVTDSGNCCPTGPSESPATGARESGKGPCCSKG